MLVEFTVSNFKSIKEPQTLSMVATNAKEHPENVFQPSPNEDIKLLKTAVIYGANASGKSNLLEAFLLLDSLLLHSAKKNPGDKLEEYYPFKLATEYHDKPTSFEVEFFGLDQIRYKYLFAFNKNEIVEEALYYYPKKQENKLFVRKKGKEILFGDSLKGNKKIIESQLLPNQLFISKAVINNNEQLIKVYGGINKIGYITSNLQLLTEETNKGIVRGNKYNNYELRNSLTNLIRAADTGVNKVDINLTPNERGQFLPKFSHKLFTNNIEKSEIEFDLEELSEGTQKLYGLGGFLLQLLQSKFLDTFVYDELNKGFHPLLSEMFIKLFQNSRTNPNNAQFIFNTHDTSLLSPELFRRDQIWFTEKDQYGATSLFSLAEFDLSKVRANIPFDKWYLNGMFGALPIIQQFNTFPDAEPPKKAKRKAVS